MQRKNQLWSPPRTRLSSISRTRPSGLTCVLRTRRYGFLRSRWQNYWRQTQRRYEYEDDITGILNVSGKAEYERKRQELAAKYKAEFVAYECDRDIGTKEFTIEYDDKHKCAEVVLAYILTSYPASRAYGIYAGR